MVQESNIKDRGLAVIHQLSKSAVLGYLEHLLGLIVNLTSELVNCDICSIMILDPEKNNLSVRATQSLDSEYLQKRPIPVEKSLSGMALVNKKTMQWEDVTKESRFQYLPMAKRLGLKTLLSIPMIIGERPIGVINFYSVHSRHFSKTEIFFLEAIANQATLAIERTELADQAKKMEQALEERKYIEKAKGILMQKRNLSEKEAHELLRKTSMNTRKTMEELAKAILLTEEL